MLADADGIAIAADWLGDWGVESADAVAAELWGMVGVAFAMAHALELSAAARVYELVEFRKSVSRYLRAERVRIVNLVMASYDGNERGPYLKRLRRSIPEASDSGPAIALREQIDGLEKRSCGWLAAHIDATLREIEPTLREPTLTLPQILERLASALARDARALRKPIVEKHEVTDELRALVLSVRGPNGRRPPRAAAANITAEYRCMPIPVARFTLPFYPIPLRASAHDVETLCDKALRLFAGRCDALGLTLRQQSELLSGLAAVAPQTAYGWLLALKPV